MTSKQKLSLLVISEKYKIENIVEESDVYFIISVGLIKNWLNSSTYRV